MIDGGVSDVGVEKADEEWSAPPTEEAFHVHDDTSANWVIRKITEARAYAQRCEAWAERERRRAQRDEAFFLFRYGPQLRDYLRQKLTEQGGKRKSVVLPAGILGYRTQTAKLVIDHEDTVMAWAKAHCPGLIETLERLSKSALNAHFENTGELPPAGAHVEPAFEKLYVK